MKGLENAIRNLNSLDTRMVPQASAWAINRVAQKAVSVTRQKVAFIRQLKEQATRQNLSSSELLRAKAAQLGV